MGSSASHPVVPHKTVSTNVKPPIKSVNNIVPAPHTSNLNHKALPSTDPKHYTTGRHSPIPHDRDFRTHNNRDHSLSRYSPVSHNQKYHTHHDDHHSPSKYSPIPQHHNVPSHDEHHNVPPHNEHHNVPPHNEHHNIPSHDEHHHHSLSRHSPVQHHENYPTTQIRRYSPIRYSPTPQNEIGFYSHRTHASVNQGPRYQHKPVTNQVLRQPMWDSSPPKYRRKGQNVNIRGQNHPNSQKIRNEHNHRDGEICYACHQSLTPRNGLSDAFEATLEKYFPGSYKMDEFVFQTKEALVPKGFYPHVNTLACIGLCRDEITTPFLEAIEALWGEGFICGSLGGMLFCGDTGFGAAHHHAPDEGNFVYYCFTHIGIDHEGTLGSVYRTRSGMNEKSTACGALAAFASEIAANKLNLNIDENDIEMSMLKKQILKKTGLSVDPHYPPSLLAVTMAAYETITMDLEKYVRNDAKKYKGRKYALFTGVQIHGPQGSNYCWMGKASLLVNGTLAPLQFGKHHHARQTNDEHPSQKH